MPTARSSLAPTSSPAPPASASSPTTTWAASGAIFWRSSKRSGGGRRRVLEIDVHLPVLHLGAEGLEIDGAGRLHGLAGSHVEGAVDIVDGEHLIADLEALDAAGREIGCGADGNRMFCHDLTDNT